MCLLHAFNLSLDPLANAAVSVFDFDRIDDIQLYLGTAVQIDDIAEACVSDKGVDLDTGDVRIPALYAGFGKMVEFLSTFGEAYRRVASNSDQTAVFRKVAQLLRWRLHFIEAQSLLYDEAVNRYLDSIGISAAEQRETFRSHLREVSESWREMQGPAMAMAVG